MHLHELMTYCKRHNLEVVETYTTFGEECGMHARAIVKHKETGEQYYLYYDASRHRRSLIPRARGWRNTTLDNRRRKERRVAKYHATVTHD